MTSDAGHPASHRRRPSRPSWLAVAVPLAAAGLLLTIPHFPRGEVTPDAGSAEVPVSRTVLGCPSPGTGPAGDDVRTWAGLAPAALLPGAELRSGGQGSVGPLPEGSARPLAVGRGELVAAPTAPDLALLGTEAAARGLFAARVLARPPTRPDGAPALAVGPCVAPQREWWFAGAGAGIDHRSVVWLTNADTGPAVVDLTVLGATGRVDTEGTRGLTLAPGQTRAVPLVDVAPGSDELTVRVVAGRGRVVAAVADELRAPRATGPAAGVEWLPSASPPATDLVVGGIPATADRHTLVVTNPEDRQALVSLQLVTERGAFVPKGLERLTVAPGRIRTVDLTEAVGQEAASVRLRSEVALSATVRSTLRGDPSYAVTAGAAPTGSTVAVIAGDRTVLQLTGVDSSASTAWHAFTADGDRVGEGNLVAPRSGLVSRSVPAGAAYVVVEPVDGDGRLVVVHSGPGLSVGEPALLPSTQQRPEVRPATG